MNNFPLHHIGVAVNDLDTSIKEYKRDFGYEVLERETLETSGVELVFLKIPNTLIELIAPTRADSAIGKFLKKNGPGLHHLCYEVKDIVAELARLKALGHTLIDEKPRPGAMHSKIAFLHPKMFSGVLVELCQLAT